MNFNELSLEALIASASGDAELENLFGGPETLKKMRDAQKLQGDARLRMAQSVLNIYNSEDGKVLFDYLFGAYIRRFNNVTGLGLPMETAIQLHAERDGQRELVHDLMRMINEARNPTLTKEA
jgi:hypothetical protein